jgi:hypothetical protein
MPSLTVAERIGNNHAAWDPVEQPPIFKCWTDDGNSYSWPFHHTTAAVYNARLQRLLIDWALGTIVVAGPKVLEFYSAFADHKAFNLKPDGLEIVSVTFEKRED